jgi:hypothetical protein
MAQDLPPCYILSMAKKRTIPRTVDSKPADVVLSADYSDWLTSLKQRISRIHLMFFQPPQMELHLPLVGRLERPQPQLEFDGEQPAELAVIEQEVDVKHVERLRESDCKSTDGIVLGFCWHHLGNQFAFVSVSPAPVLVFAADLRDRAEYYGREQRWPDATFWRRRHSSSGRDSLRRSRTQDKRH